MTLQTAFVPNEQSESSASTRTIYYHYYCIVIECTSVLHNIHYLFMFFFSKSCGEFSFTLVTVKGLPMYVYAHRAISVIALSLVKYFLFSVHAV